MAGQVTFKVRLVTIESVDNFGQPETYQVPRLDMLDEKGKLLWDIEHKDVPPGEMWNLFNVARRIGNRLDVRLATAIDALDSL